MKSYDIVCGYVMRDANDATHDIRVRGRFEPTVPHMHEALRRDVEGVVAALTRNHATVPSGERERGGNDLWQKQQYPSRIHT